MKKLLKTIWRKYRFEPEKEEDKIAYSYLKNYDWILDVGCGEGRFFAQKPKKIRGIDWNRQSIKKCKEKGYQVKRADARALPFKDESVPAIHCSHLIEHFLPVDVHKILSEINRVLKPGGMLIIRSPLMWDKFYADLTHIKPYQPAAIVRYLTPGHQQHTLRQITDQFQAICLKWNYQPFAYQVKYLDAPFNILNRWGFPWLKKNRYLLVLRKKQ